MNFSNFKLNKTTTKQITSNQFDTAKTVVTSVVVGGGVFFACQCSRRVVILILISVFALSLFFVRFYIYDNFITHLYHLMCVCCFFFQIVNFDCWRFFKWLIYFLFYIFFVSKYYFNLFLCVYIPSRFKFILMSMIYVSRSCVCSWERFNFNFLFLTKKKKVD